MPTALLTKLPNKAKRLWEAAYKNSRGSGKDIETSAKIATGAVKKLFKKKKGVWVTKSLKIKLHLIKHGWIFPNYKFELELSNNKWDVEDQRVSEELLQRMVTEGKLDSVGDVDHERYYKKHNMLSDRNLINPDNGTEGLYNLESYKYEGGSVKAIVSMNRGHNLFSKYLKLHKEGKFLYASAEFPNSTIENGVILDADRMLWSITDNPAGMVGKAKAVV